MRIAFLQETHQTTFDQFRLRRGWVGQFYHSNFHSKPRGAATLINKNVSFFMSTITADSAGHYIIVVGKLYNTPVVQANLYAPNWEDSTFLYQFLFYVCPTWTRIISFLGGDMNCVLSSILDQSSPGATTLSKEAQAIKLFLILIAWLTLGASETPHVKATLSTYLYTKLTHALIIFF